MVFPEARKLWLMALTSVVLDRDVDSGLDETESPHSTSPAAHSYRELQKDQTLSIRHNGDLKHNSDLMPKSEIDAADVNNIVTPIEHPYFKSPLELQLEKKLELLRSNETLLKNIQRSETKNLTHAQASLEAEFQTTRDVWKRLYFDSKAKTIPLDEQAQTKKNELEKYRDEILRRMKTKVVKRSQQRLTSDALWRKRNFLQRRESRVNKHGRTQKLSPLDVNRQLLHDEFSLKMEAMKMEKLAQKTEEVRGRVQKAGLNLKESKQENRKLKSDTEEMRKELKALSRGGSGLNLGCDFFDIACDVCRLSR